MQIDADIVKFQQTIWEYYDAHGRHDLPWRLPDVDGNFDPYKIMVSELMLQQTQVGRVIPKFLAFTKQYPTAQSLANAPLADVLILWSGLGYNRRAKFLWQAAQAVLQNHDGKLPATKEELVKLPGVGANTAGAILAYAYNQPVSFIETNIRTVFFHHFFHDQKDIPDTALLPLLEKSLPADNARLWYWALMDYGTHLKQTVGNASRASAHYAKQSKFDGSRRQIRGMVLRLLAIESRTILYLHDEIPDERLDSVLSDLIKEGFIKENDSHYQLSA
ncbi:MAG: A/G-specific adenine glycosylase [Candidatus Saccharimonadales bacterium]